jgi:hypothetical protein
LGLEESKFVKGVAVIALGGIDAALKAGELLTVLGEDAAEGPIVNVEGPLPEVGFDGAETAEEPIAIDEGVDEETLLGGGGLEALVIFGGEFLEGCRGFALDDLGFSVDAGFECVHGGSGLALGGARSGGFARVGAVGRDLFLRCHGGRIAGGKGVVAGAGGEVLEKMEKKLRRPA